MAVWDDIGTRFSLLDRKCDEDNNAGYNRKRKESLGEEFYGLALLPIHVHKRRPKEKSVAHEGNREDQQAKHCYRSEDGVRLTPYVCGTVGDKEYNKNNVNSGD